MGKRMHQARYLKSLTLLATLASVALAQPAIAAETANTDLAPVEVANLYIKTVVNEDEASIAALNDYLRATRLAGHQPAEYASFSDLRKAAAEFPIEMGKTIAGLFPAAMQASLTPAARQLAANVLAAKNGAICKTTGAEPVKEERGIQTAAVSFECQIVKAPLSWAQAAQQLAKSGCKAEQCEAGLKKIADSYATGPQQTWSAVFPVSREKSTEAWRNDFARETFNDIWEYL